MERNGRFERGLNIGRERINSERGLELVGLFQRQYLSVFKKCLNLCFVGRVSNQERQVLLEILLRELLKNIELGPELLFVWLS